MSWASKKRRFEKKVKQWEKEIGGLKERIKNAPVPTKTIDDYICKKKNEIDSKIINIEDSIKNGHLETAKTEIENLIAGIKQIKIAHDAGATDYKYISELGALYAALVAKYEEVWREIDDLLTVDDINNIVIQANALKILFDTTTLDEAPPQPGFPTQSEFDGLISGGWKKLDSEHDRHTIHKEVANIHENTASVDNSNNTDVFVHKFDFVFVLVSLCCFGLDFMLIKNSMVVLNSDLASDSVQVYVMAGIMVLLTITLHWVAGLYRTKKPKAHRWLLLGGIGMSLCQAVIRFINMIIDGEITIEGSVASVLVFIISLIGGLVLSFKIAETFSKDIILYRKNKKTINSKQETVERFTPILTELDGSIVSYFKQIKDVFKKFYLAMDLSSTTPSFPEGDDFNNFIITGLVSYIKSELEQVKFDGDVPTEIVKEKFVSYADITTKQLPNNNEKN